MQRALGASEPPGTPLMKLQASPNKVTAPAKDINKETCQPDKPQQKDTSTPVGSKTKQTSAPGSPQRKPPASVEQQAKPEVKQGPESRPALGGKSPQEGRKTDAQKPPDQKSQTERKQSSASVKQEESTGFFGFSGPKSQSDAAKPAESLGGKMFGFGSSIFSSASTLINSAAQDESKKTPPASPKATPQKPLSQKEQQEKKTAQPKTSPMLQTKVEKAPSGPKNAGVAPTVPKEGQSTCPLCKVKLNFGSKEPPNYNQCTECKNTVCNQCGFNPMPNVSEVIIKRFQLPQYA